MEKKNIGLEDQAGTERPKGQDERLREERRGKAGPHGDLEKDKDGSVETDHDEHEQDSPGQQRGTGIPGFGV